MQTERDFSAGLGSYGAHSKSALHQLFAVSWHRSRVRFLAMADPWANYLAQRSRNRGLRGGGEAGLPGGNSRLVPEGGSAASGMSGQGQRVEASQRDPSASVFRNDMAPSNVAASFAQQGYPSWPFQTQDIGRSPWIPMLATSPGQALPNGFGPSWTSPMVPGTQPLMFQPPVQPQPQQVGPTTWNPSTTFAAPAFTSPATTRMNNEPNRLAQEFPSLRQQPQPTVCWDLRSSLSHPRRRSPQLSMFLGCSLRSQPVPVRIKENDSLQR